MRKKKKKKISFIFRISVFISFFILCSPSFLVGNTKDQTVARVMFYNVENLFDTENDSLKLDDEFTLKGERYWNNTKFYNKINRIYKVIIAASNWQLPDVIGLCEVENHKVLEILIHKTPLEKLGYRIVHQESPDKRGIDVAFLYNNNTFQPISYKAIPVEDIRNKSFKTRDILYVKGILNTDTVHFYVNHWPSKYGGLVETKPLRKLAANVLRSNIDSLLVKNNYSKIIVIGDFNDTPFDESIEVHLNAKTDFNSIMNSDIYNLSYTKAKEGLGTIKYQGKWELIDQMMVSGSLLTNNGLTTSDSLFSIFKSDFIMERDKKHLGVKPFRTYVGFKYNNGYSDHLPVLLDPKYIKD